MLAIVPRCFPCGYGPAVPNEFDLLRDRLRKFADARDWNRFHTPRNLALALAGEVGELAAELQWVSDIELDDHLRDQEARIRLGAEAADVLIYLVRFADVCGLDLLSEAHAKIERNESRYRPGRAGPHAAPAQGRGPDARE
jgi:dCTP diphosphatase